MTMVSAMTTTNVCTSRTQRATAPCPVASTRVAAAPSAAAAPAGPTESQLQDILGTDFVTVTCETLPDEHHDGTYGLLTGGYTLGAVQGDDASGYTVNLTLKLTNYVEAFGTDTRKVHTPAEGETDRQRYAAIQQGIAAMGAGSRCYRRDLQGGLQR